VSLTDVEIVAAVDAELGSTMAALASSALKIGWFNEGVHSMAHRNGRFKPKTDDITWALGDRSVALEADFIAIDKITTSAGYRSQSWRVFGETLVLDDSDGATQAGAARVYYWAEWPLITISPASTSGMTYHEDFVVKDFVLSRFYKLLASNRLYYKRYATMVGQNAVSAADLQNEADRYYQDFLDGQEHTLRTPPAFFYEG
jgi:hypothetical protein